VLVNAQGQLGTASAAGKLADGAPEAKLRAHVRRQDREIATLKRAVRRLARR
jgi:hypothetical protein